MINDIKNYIKSSGIYRVIRSFKKVISTRHPLQKIKNKEGYNYTRLGTVYGGWTFLDEPYLHNSIIVSAGLGEDASFDIEFAEKYNATIVIIDPTPRAIEHFKGIEKRIGKINEVNNLDYAGKLPVEAYDLSKVEKSQFKLVAKALWNENKLLKFFTPSNSDHVSHSIVNFQNNYSNETNYIEVESCTMSDLIKLLSLKIDDIPLIKLDIEGAEIEVIEDLISTGFRPHQLLVEYDELNKPSKISYGRVSKAHQILTDNDYECIYTDGQSDFLYIYKNIKSKK